MSKIFADNLKILRFKKGVSQNQLAQICGVSQNLVWQWENNKTEPMLETLKKLASYFEVTLDELVGYEIVFTHSVAREGSNQTGYGDKKAIEEALAELERNKASNDAAIEKLRKRLNPENK